MLFQALFARKRESAPSVTHPKPHVAAGQRVYAIGDVHGHADLLRDLLAKIDADDAARGAAQTRLIFLGDLIDRGPASAEVLDIAMELAASDRDVRFLMGNHEEVFLAAMEGSDRAMRFFTRIGGRETILSYGLCPKEYDLLDYGQTGAWALQNIPQHHVDFVRHFENMIEVDDYLFVHAGVRPDVPLGEQTAKDMRWIREDFLSYEGRYPRFIVHGHTISDGVDEQHNRIGIDTGAYAGGALTAVGLEGTDRWYLTATAS